ncbi:hypothetical protein BJX63DRAFT_381778 [Aspergillus granulosus]|uniref:Uncharacterized protein n=1 Tax=Aspergillus granulosus TaxID=176169 RepID=A0ABR4HYI2_9EURO
MACPAKTGCPLSPATRPCANLSTVPSLKAPNPLILRPPSSSQSSHAKSRTNLVGRAWLS